MITATKSNNRGGVSKVRKEGLHARFIQWQARTSEERKAEGLPFAKDFAKHYDIGENTLSRWKKRPDYQELKREAQILRFGDRSADVLEGLTRRCIKYGMAYDVELWWLYVEGWDRKHILEILKEVTLGEDDIRSLVEYLPKEKQKKFYETLVNLIAEAEKARAITRN